MRSHLLFTEKPAWDTPAFLCQPLLWWRRQAQYLANSLAYKPA